MKRGKLVATSKGIHQLWWAFVMLLIVVLQGCRYELPPVQPRNYSFPMKGGVTEPHRSVDYEGFHRRMARDFLRAFGVPLRSRCLRLVVAEGERRVDLTARLSAMELLAWRHNRAAIKSILQWSNISDGRALRRDFCLSKLDPKRFPPSALRDSFAQGNYISIDSILLAGCLARLGDPSNFGTIQNTILHDKKSYHREDAVMQLWYFWPFQGQSRIGSPSIDLFPLMRAALNDSSKWVFYSAIRQYEYAPRSPILKADLEQLLADSLDEARSGAAMSILVYRYHRKEIGYSKDMRSYWSRRKRTYKE